VKEIHFKKTSFGVNLETPRGRRHPTLKTSHQWIYLKTKIVMVLMIGVVQF